MDLRQSMTVHIDMLVIYFNSLKLFYKNIWIEGLVKIGRNIQDLSSEVNECPIKSSPNFISYHIHNYISLVRIWEAGAKH